eukprot:TRINITY_DN7526_c0_g1_i2.p1 TRINITY_DN7526_c0_g1~~TRINITY_DN7526_c0_g1_i2.p1  ORF type:complete len:298 (+),score=24.43 TRINITY_DN7526_c0_g1_i2:89-982(+)
MSCRRDLSQLLSIAGAAAVGATVGYLLARQTGSSTTNDITENGPKYKVPKRLILVRHGQSEGNVDHTIYKHTADNALHLTRAGQQQALAAGRRLKELLGDEPAKFIVSPYVRTRETFAGIAQSFSPSGNIDDLDWSEDPRLREQDFGNYQDPEVMAPMKRERKDFGAFYYRFPEGESSADVYDRVSSFLDSQYRRWNRDLDTDIVSTVLVVHGLTINVFLMRYFKYSVDEFNQYENFDNCEFLVMERDDVDGNLRIKKVVQGSQDGKTCQVHNSQRKKPEKEWVTRDIWDGKSQVSQ